MKHDKKQGFASLLACVLFCAGCDSVSLKETTANAPLISSFSPESGSIGSEVVITGEYLNNVTGATIGGGQTVILQKVSDKRLTLKVTGNARSGPIALSNPAGEGLSETEFILEYPAPVLTEDALPAQVEMGNKLLLSGNYMNVISAVLFTAEGQAAGNEASVLSQGEKEILVKIPYVEGDRAAVTFRYFNGTEETETPLASAPQTTVKRYEPQVTAAAFEPAAVGDIVVLNGSYLDKIDRVLLGNAECPVTFRSGNELRFAVPASDSYTDGVNTMPLAISYFEGRETVILTDAFVVKVPSVYRWENKKVYAQGRDTEELASFFSPETGRVYANADWRETVDPVSYRYQAATCSANNQPAVPESEYDSVNPYFFFSGVNAGQLQINSPAGSGGQLKNFYIANNSANEYRITGTNGNCYGTPVLTFLYLDPAKSAHRTLIDEVKSGTLEIIDEATFPIDIIAKTCRGFSISGMKTSMNTDTWAPGIFTVGTEKKAPVDAVLLVLYYDVNGSAVNVADHIRRIGLLHIKTVDFKLYNNTNAPSSSSVEFDMYWQKHDYDYAKIH